MNFQTDQELKQSQDHSFGPTMILSKPNSKSYDEINMVVKKVSFKEELTIFVVDNWKVYNRDQQNYPYFQKVYTKKEISCSNACNIF